MKKAGEIPFEPMNFREKTTSELLTLISGSFVDESPELPSLARMTVAEIRNTLNIPIDAARKIEAALELASRNVVLQRNVSVKSGEDVERYFRARLGREDRESFWVLTLNQKHHIIDLHRISEGTLSMTPVHPREVFSRAIRDSASAVIFVHNHPSGNPEPSPDDITLTERLIKSGEILGIRILDHIVVGAYEYASIRNMNPALFSPPNSVLGNGKAAESGAYVSESRLPSLSDFDAPGREGALSDEPDLL